MTTAPSPADPADAADAPFATPEALRAAILACPEAVLDDAEVARALLQAQGQRAPEGARNIVDLRGALVDRLENRLGQLEETHRSVVSAAYDNQAVTVMMHRAALAVLEPEDFEHLCEALGRHVPAILGVESLRIAVEGEESPDQPAPPAPFVRLLHGGVASYMFRHLGQGAEEDGPERAVVLRAAGPEAGEVFGAEGERIGSEALVRLEGSGDAGSLSELPPPPPQAASNAVIKNTGAMQNRCARPEFCHSLIRNPRTRTRREYSFTG